MYCIIRNMNSQLWVFFWMFNCVFQSFMMQNVNVQMLIVFNVYFWFNFYWNFMVFNFVQFVDSYNFIFSKVGFCNDVVCFVFFVVQQLEGIQQVVVSGFSNLDICNYVMFFQVKLFDFGWFNFG